MYNPALEISHAFRNAGLACPVITQIDELYRTDPRPDWLHPTVDVNAEVGRLLAGELTPEAVAAAEFRRGPVVRELSAALLNRRDAQADRLLHEGAGELETVLLDALTASEDAQRSGEVELARFGVRPPWRVEQGEHDDYPSVIIEPTEKLRYEAAAAGSAALAAYERWRAGWDRRKAVRGLVIRCVRLGLLAADSPAARATVHWPRTGAAKQGVTARVRAALAKSRARQESGAA